MPNNEEEEPTTWWQWIVNVATSMAQIYDVLVEYGIISQGEADDYLNQGLSREEIAALVDQRIAATAGWEKWIPWVITGALGSGLLYVLLKKK